MHLERIVLITSPPTAVPPVMHDDSALPSKEHLERQELHQRIRYGPFQLIATILGAAAFLLTLGIDRCTSRREQVWSRAVVVSSEIDSLLGATRAAVARNDGRAVLVRVSVETMADRAESFALALDRARVPASAPIREEVRQFRAALRETVGQFARDSTTLNEWADAATLQALWRARALQPTPDFARLFGDTLLREWRTLAEQGDAMISARYSLLGDVRSTGAFDSAAVRFQRRLYDALEHRRP